MSLETLPEEIVIKILLFLNPIERINFGKTCKNFSRLSLDRAVLKEMDCSHDYTFQRAHWKLITRHACAHLVNTLNLNGITWLSNSELKSGIARMINLEKLFLLDANISSTDLKPVFKRTMKIKKLAISLKPDTGGRICHEYINLPLTHLMVTYNGYGVQSLARLLTQFELLEELWLIEPMIPFEYKISHDRDWFNFGWPKIPKVTKRIVLSRQFCAPSNHSELITKLKAPDGNWLCLEQINDEFLFFVVENFNKKDAKLPTFDLRNDFEVALHTMITDFHMKDMICTSDKRDMIMKDLPYHKMNFTCLNLVQYPSGSNSTYLFDDDLVAKLFEQLLFSSNLTKLNRFRCETIPFWQQPDLIFMNTELFKRRKLELQSDENSENCRFARFTRHTPHMKDFELIDTIELIRDTIWPPDCLKYICNWKKLNKLVISSENIVSAKFLVEVAMHCSQLRVLKLKIETVTDLTADVCKALVHCKNLRDFRYERKGSIVIDSMFEALAQCTALERIFIQCRFVSKLSKEPIARTVNSCGNLHFMFVHIREFTDAVCNQITRDITKMRKLPFVAKIVGQNFRIEDIRYRDVSIYHVQDIMTHTNCPYFEFTKNF